MARTVTLEIRNEEFEIFPERAVLYRRRAALLVSDLHWGRENFMQTRGIPVPDLALSGEMLRLDRALQLSSARELWILGDWIHHPEGMSEQVVQKIQAWLTEKSRSGIRIRFVPGNHDRQVSRWLDIAQVELCPRGIQVDGFRFDHEDRYARSSLRDDFVICGHLHPAYRLRSAVDDLKLHCFWVRPEVAYLPAFSSLAAGAVIEPDFSRDKLVLLTPEGAHLLERGRAPRREVEDA